MQNARVLKLAVLCATLAILLAQGIATALLVERARKAQVAAAHDTVERVARSVEASINRAFVQVDAMLAGLPAVLEPFSRDGQLDLDAVNRVLRELNNQNFTYRDVLLVGPDGLPAAAALTVSRNRRLPVSVETGFAELATRGGSVSIGGPVQNPTTGEWTLFFARKVTIPNRGPMLAIAEVPVPLVQSLLSVGGEAPGMRVTLERSDGTLMASMPHDETRIGERLSPPATSFARTGWVEETSGRFSSGPVFMAARSTLYPALSVSATLKVDSALAGWYKDRERAMLVSGALALLVITAGLALMVALRQRERVEAERARARRTLENALESMSDGFVMFDAEDRLIACNSRYKDFYKVSAPFIVPGATFEEIMREGARRGQYPQVGDDIEAFVNESKVWHRGNHPPMERLLPDGRWVLITERRTPDGGTVGIRTDITELKRAMQELAAARDAAAAAGEAKGKFLARMSHELRTPLNGVLGFTQVLQQDPHLTSSQREQLHTIHEAGRHLLDLVNSLLDLSKIEAGHFDIVPRPTRLRDILEGCAALLRPDVERKALTFLLDADPELPTVVEADPTRLRQLLLNLLSNAVKFTPRKGRVSLSVRRFPGDILRFEVQDSGPGIPADKQHLLFEDFVQLTPAPDQPGTGLGLAISARLAALMGGRIGCISEAGEGALFWVELPLRDCTTALPPGPAPSSPQETSSANGRLRVLVVDDIEANREVARAMLAGLGHHVEVAADGPAAVAAAAAGTFDAILMDVQMPGMDGLEATQSIRRLPEPASRVRVIAVTASILPDQVRACRAAGMDGHLTKPIDRETLKTVLEGKPQGPEPTAPPNSEPWPLLDGAALDSLEQELDAAAHGIIAELIGELRSALSLLTEASAEERDDPERVRYAAHRLLGAARTLGARSVAGHAEELQRAAANGDPAPALQAAVITAVAATLPRLDERLARIPAGTGRTRDDSR